MIRSGEHDLWDAYMATAPARAHIAALADLGRLMARAFAPVRKALLAAATEMARFATAFDQLRAAAAPPSLAPRTGASPCRARAPGDPRQETDDQSDLT